MAREQTDLAESLYSENPFQPIGLRMLDDMDVKILSILQEDCTRPVAEIGKEVGLSTTPCWRRIQKLEELGVIKRRVAVLDPVKVNAGVTVFISIKTVETHVGKVLHKLQLSNRHELAHWAAQRRIV